MARVEAVRHAISGDDALINIVDDTGNVYSIGPDGDALTITKNGSAYATPATITSYDDDEFLSFGTSLDTNVFNRSTVLNANTTVTDAIVGTPVTQATPANSLIISNQTADGDVVVMTNTGGNSLESIRVDASAQKIQLGHGVFDTNIMNGTGLVVGHTAQVTAGTVTPELQVLGTAATDAAVLIGAWSTTDSVQPELGFLKSGNATIGSSTIVATNENLGRVVWYADDGTDYVSVAASIGAVALATQGANDSPGAIDFNVTPDAAQAPVQVARMSAAGGLALGVAGSRSGILSLAGVTSGVVTISVADAAGTYSLTLPPDNGDAGEQLQTDGSGVMTWEAAGSIREVKNFLGQMDPHEALDRILDATIYRFKYKPEATHFVTNDFETEYTGIVADEAPWAMHHNGKIFSPVSAFGHAAAAIQALASRVTSLEARLAASPA